MSENKTFTLNLLARPFDAIKKGTKTVAKKGPKKISLIVTAGRSRPASWLAVAASRRLPPEP